MSEQCSGACVAYLGGVLEAVHVGVRHVLAAGGGGGAGQVPQRRGHVARGVQQQHLRLRRARAQRARAALHHLAQLHCAPQMTNVKLCNYTNSFRKYLVTNYYKKN